MIAALATRAGAYFGDGINHEQQPFRGELTLAPVADGVAVAIDYQATGQDGTRFHTEHTVLAPDGQGAPTLTTINAHGAGLHTLHLRSDGPQDGSDRTLVFGLNDRDDPSAFRFEIAIDLWPDNALTYRHAWGLPGGEFAPRSGVRLTRI